ncbi:MAG: DUF2752 domain-containing protein [Bacteroidales bacterium]|nr:DUF2752 domain-containing protein [Bacteroidales bacterium]MBP7873601.1 DUF2752 domain-containing protein [Bacteroidales bacterium]MCZ2282623.1 DUF2752 domain-containing protein [Bacteroidales bacterium]NLH33648.1 DUF2752 domain-containing protein [Lentimicrobium sp.]OQC38446.1 MAG: hypothetical protein BWX63_00326 [Bacteroidetes bacterium ADurb.Bin041]
MYLFKQISKNLYFNLELIIWLGALLFLFLSPINGHHYTLCPLSNLGVESCPGCGLGRSVSMALHGNISKSIEMHPFGLIAVIVIFQRIVFLSINFFHFKHPKTTTS